MRRSGVIPRQQQAWAFWRQDRGGDAVEAAWAAFDLDPGDRATKGLLTRLLRNYPEALRDERRKTYLALLTDRDVEPDLINVAGWHLVLRSHRLSEDRCDDDAACEAFVAALEHDELTLTLLREAPVGLAAAERLLTRLRRWLLLSGQWRGHPDMVTALNAQAALNGGAWPFDTTEAASLSQPENAAMTTAYLPAWQGTKALAPDTADPITAAVTAQYEGWPYPVWTRITPGEPKSLPGVIGAMNAELAKALPVAANVLVAGCGTGRQAASVALRLPDAAVTAIDVSEPSLDYARRQCGALGIANIRFIKLDLRDAAALNQRFHAIYSSGVLHHLPDPERGLERLADALHPGGVMNLMLYSRYQRLMTAGARSFLIGDLLLQPVSDDLLRQVRRRFLERPGHSAAAYVIRSRDFATLAGTYDLLLHRHEDPFDLPRIGRALDQAGLRLLSLVMPTPAVAARYDAAFPGDPRRCNIASLAQFEIKEPILQNRHYTFWCYKPGRNAP